MTDATALTEAPARQAAYTGILPSQAIREMVGSGEISATEILERIEPDQIQPASIDLRLGRYAYPVDTSFLPGRGTRVLEKMRELDADIERFKIEPVTLVTTDHRPKVGERVFAIGHPGGGRRRSADQHPE